MRRPYPRLAAACALAVATAVLATGSAAAGGNPNAPGHQKNDQTTQQAQTQQTQTAAQHQTAAPEQGQASDQRGAGAQSSSNSSSAAQADGHGSSASTSTEAGVKPSSTTTHWTHCKTGSSSSGATCTSSDNGHTPQTGPDVSKHYGNGKTAAQIAVSRGGTNVQLTGPGNSQPHKVSVCGKPSNKSGGVDVHAVKSYSNLHCGSPHEETPPTAPCGYVVVAVVVNGETHYVLHRVPHASCGTTTGTTTTAPHTTTTAPHTTTTALHETTTVPTTTTAPHTTTTMPTTTTVPHTTVSTTTAAAATTGAGTTTEHSTTTTQSTTTQQVAATTTSAGGGTAQSTHGSTSGVLGASKTLKPQRASAGRGVLGTVTHVANGTLPFTGFPLWVAVLIAFALIGVGFALRRRGTTT